MYTIAEYEFRSDLKYNVDTLSVVIQLYEVQPGDLKIH